MTTLAARERRIRKLATKKGWRVSKVRAGQDRGRYLLLVDNAAVANTASAAFPNSFSLEEAEEKLTR